MKKFNKFIILVFDGIREDHSWSRNGQRLINELRDYDSKAYEEITATEHDCFYDDKKIEKTLEFLFELWSDNAELSSDPLDGSGWDVNFSKIR